MQDQFKQTYFEECDDRIQEAEDGLSQMLDGEASSDIVDQVFRAIHSIKGGAGAFAFTQIVAFSHEFETVLDDVREGKLIPDRTMCTVFLRANDVVADMLSREQRGEAIPDDLGADILVELQAIAGRSGDSEGAPQDNPISSREDDAPSMDTWDIHFAPHPYVLTTGNEPLYILQALADLGDCEVQADLSGLPDLADIDPETCYTTWRITLKTDHAEADIREVFDFVEDMCDLQMTRVEEPKEVAEPIEIKAKTKQEPTQKIM